MRCRRLIRKLAAAIIAYVLFSCGAYSAADAPTTNDGAIGDTAEAGGGDATASAFCGDGIKSPEEACDGTDLGGATCASAIAMGWTGDLACTSVCSIDASRCGTPRRPTERSGQWPRGQRSTSQALTPAR